MGNKAGWIVAGVLVLVVAGIIFLNINPFEPQPSAPTYATLGQGALDFKDIDTQPAGIIPAKPSGAGNAADDYAQAIRIYKSNQEMLKKVIAPDYIDGIWGGSQKLADNEIQALKQVDQHIAAGAAKEKMEYCLAHTPKEFNVGWRYRPADDLMKIARCEEALAGDHFARKEFAQCEPILQRVFVMGLHLINERARAYATVTGIDVQNIAIMRMANQLYKGMGEDVFKKKLKPLQEYLDRLQSLNLALTTKDHILRVAKPEPGDVFNIVGSPMDPGTYKGDKDHAWRVQGILTLGIVKFVATEEGDRKYAEKLIDQYVGSKDPLEAAAAAAAKAFTREQKETYATDDTREE